MIYQVSHMIYRKDENDNYYEFRSPSGFYEMDAKDFPKTVKEARVDDIVDFHVNCGTLNTWKIFLVGENNHMIDLSMFDELRDDLLIQETIHRITELTKTNSEEVDLLDVLKLLSEEVKYTGKRNDEQRIVSAVEKILTEENNNE